jgi:hypothetical protein
LDRNTERLERLHAARAALKAAWPLQPVDDVRRVPDSSGSIPHSDTPPAIRVSFSIVPAGFSGDPAEADNAVGSPLRFGV